MLRPASYKIVYLRVQNLQWQYFHQRRCARFPITIYLDLKAVFAVTNAHGNLPRPGIYFSEQQEFLRPVPNQVLRTGAAKGFSPPKVGYSL
jgi:hypothetical protein